MTQPCARKKQKKNEKNKTKSFLVPRSIYSCASYSRWCQLPHDTALLRQPPPPVLGRVSETSFSETINRGGGVATKKCKWRRLGSSRRHFPADTSLGSYTLPPPRRREFSTAPSPLSRKFCRTHPRCRENSINTALSLLSREKTRVEGCVLCAYLACRTVPLWSEM